MMSPSTQKEAPHSKSHPPEKHTHADAPTEKVAAKRQRRPSVRLGEIGGYQSSDSNRKNTNKNQILGKQLRVTKNKDSINLKNSETLGEGKKLNRIEIGTSKRSTKRIRSNLVNVDDKFSGGKDRDNDDDEFRVSDSESPEREISPIQSNENGDHLGNYRGGVSRVLESPSENGDDGERNGVKVWLDQLGLGRYGPVFDVHEVDDEVLPLLTLEDLKDMGINAVGSRRKLYAYIQKLREGFS